ncbi:MAG: hypothetical protein LBK42_02240, partial [Propionibacteriaceae bacterium]|nr:hypothetical protein [Propionibacteriaceae bacterium]
MLVWLPYLSRQQALDRLGPMPEGIEFDLAVRDHGLPREGRQRVEYFAVRNFEIDVARQVLG